MIENPVFAYVEDDLGSRLVVQMLMPMIGYPKLTVFEDSENLIDRLTALPEKPNVFLLDIHVKPIDGFQMLKLLRHHPDFRDAIIVAFTSSVMNEEVEMLRTAGFSSIIAKPVDQRRFPDLLRQILAGETVWAVG
jgi:CheY-like chemotaxis protein